MSTEPEPPIPGVSAQKRHVVVDFAAVQRVTNVVELRSIRLARISATGESSGGGPLEPVISHTCNVTKMEPAFLEVSCEYHFGAKSGAATIAEASLTYVLRYEITTGSAPRESDLAEFAFANGTLHSWPFVRHALFDLTARLGFPPFTLQTFKFIPKPAATAPAPAPAPAPASDKGAS